MNNKYRYIHGVYVEREHSGALIANLKNVETGESKLEVIENPKRPFWIVSKQFQTYEDKRISIPEMLTDMYTCPEHELKYTLGRALGYRNAKSLYLKKLFNNPYVYGADIPVTVIYKKYLKDNCPEEPKELRVGHLDIEVSVLGGNEIISFTYMSPEARIFTGVLDSFMPKNTNSEDIYRELEKQYKSFPDKINKDANAIWNKIKNIKPNIKIGSEKEIILWIIDRIHETKPDFIGIWNMGYDIPRLLERLDALRLGKMRFAHPDVPKKYKHVFFKKDMRKTEHYTDSWDWFYCTSYTQYIDSLNLYSRIRKAKGRLDSYALDNIASKEIGTGKLDFEGDTHPVMQSTRFIEYVVYNIFDVILLYIMENINHDIQQMCYLSGIADLEDFARQTVRLKYDFYDYCRQNNLVLAATGTSMEDSWDDLIVNVGGGVLDPTLAKDVGVPIIKELDRPTMLYMYCRDMDATAMYPNLKIVFNVGRDVKLANVLTIEGMQPTQHENIFSNAVSLNENAVLLESEYFNLPDYREMFNLFESSSLPA